MNRVHTDSESEFEVTKDLSSGPVQLIFFAKRTRTKGSDVECLSDPRTKTSHRHYLTTTDLREMLFTV